MSDLKPCPFCGGKAHFDRDDSGWEWIECGKCHTSSNQSVSAMEDCKPGLAEAWNRRAPTPQPEARGVKGSGAYRDEFEKETGCPWLNGDGEPDIDYVYWLERKLAHLQQAPQDYHDIPDDQLIGILTARWKMKSDFKAYAGPFISAMQAQAPQGVRENHGDPAFRKTAWNLKTLMALPMDERDKILEEAAEKGARLYSWAAPVKVDDHE